LIGRSAERKVDGASRFNPRFSVLGRPGVPSRGIDMRIVLGSIAIVACVFAAATTAAGQSPDRQPASGIVVADKPDNEKAMQFVLGRPLSLFRPVARSRVTSRPIRPISFLPLDPARFALGFQNPAGSAASTRFTNGFTTINFGAEGSTGGEMAGGSSPYAGVLSVTTAHGLQLGTNNRVRLAICPPPALMV